MLARPVDHSERAVESFPPGLLVPGVTHLVPIWRVPPARAEHRRGIDPHAAGAERVEPILARGGEVAHRGDAALHQFAQRDLGCGPPAVGIGLEQRQVFVERAHIELMAADLVGEALQHRLRGRVRVDIDKTRQDRKAACVDLDRIGVIGWPRRADRGNRAPFDRQVDIPAIDMGLRRLVPGDEPGGVANDFPRLGWFERIRHGIHRSRVRGAAQIAHMGSIIGPLYLAWTAGLRSDRSLRQR
jgi:hypothetical protein